MKLSKKIFIVFTGISLLFGVFLIVFAYLQNSIFEMNMLNEMRKTEKSFLDLKNRDIKILSSALEVFVRSQSHKKAYLQKNRQKLYESVQPLFQNLKEKHGITHFYFILPDGRCFLRVHNKKIYGDLITRFTFNRAKDSKKIASGIELGKTAFALRVVMPYYSDNELIGYVEFGQGIDHFLNDLKGDTDNEFALIAEKKYLDKDKWSSVRKEAGLKDNWSKMKNHVILCSTTEDESGAEKGYFTEENTVLMHNEQARYKQAWINERAYMLGGFKIIDAGGRNSGTVLHLIDIMAYVESIHKSRFVLLGVGILLIFLAIGIKVFLSRSILGPIRRLKEGAAEIGEGKLDARVNIKSKDEIGDLADSFNKMTESLQSTTTSINDLNKEIEERKKTEEREHQTNESLKSTLSSMDDLVFSIDNEGKFINYYQPELESQLYIPPEKFIGKPYKDVMPPHIAEQTSDAIKVLTKSGKVQEFDYSLEIEGKKQWFSTKMSVMKDSMGKYTGFTAVVRDVTEQKKFTEIEKEMAMHSARADVQMNRAQDLQNALDRLKEAEDQLVQSTKLSAIGEVSAGVTHELMQPMNNIKIISTAMRKFIEKDDYDKDSTVADLNEIKNQINKMAEIIEHMRKFSRRSEGVVREEMSVNEAVLGVFKLISRQLKVHNIEVEMDLGDGLPDIKADPIRIEQVFVNLVNNARHALESTGKSDKKLSIKTHKDEGGHSVTIEVKDNGPGIPEDIREKVFLPFFTTKASGKGTGLGLSIVKRIVDEHNGRVELGDPAKNGGEGTVFRVILPIAAP